MLCADVTGLEIIYISVRKGGSSTLELATNKLNKVIAKCFKYQGKFYESGG